MSKKNTFLLLFFLAFSFAFSQGDKLINGKIIVKDATPQGVHIINLVNEKEAISDENGVFNILAKPDDLLVFSAIHLDYFRKIIEIEDYNSPILIVEMTSKINQLEEVKVIKYPNINPVALGILSRPAVAYTPAERRLKVAGDFKPTDMVGMLFRSASFDPIINAISGRTAMLKIELQVEKREFIMLKIVDLYDDNYYAKKLKISKEYIKGFQLYCIDDKDFVTALKAKNETLIAFLIQGLSVQYKKRIRDDKK